MGEESLHKSRVYKDTPSRKARRRVGFQLASGFWWDRLGPGTLCCNACTWINISSSNKIQRNNKGLKITTCMYSGGKLWMKRYQRTKKHNCHFWRARSKSRVLCMPLALTTTIGVGKTPKPPLQPKPWTHPYSHPIQETSSHLPPWGAREPVIHSHSPLLQQGPQWSLACISCLASSISID